MPPRTERQSRGIPSLQISTQGLPPEIARVLEDIVRQAQQGFQHLAEGVDQAVGLRGEPKFYRSVNAQGHEIRDVGRPLALDSAQTRRYALSLDDDNNSYNAQGKAISNLQTAVNGGDAVPKEQMDQSMAFGFEASRGINTPPNVGATSLVGSVFSRWSREDHIHGVNQGTFTVNTTGFAVDPVGTAFYVLIGVAVILFLPQLTGTSDATTFTITGLPAAITPVRTTNHPVHVADNGVAMIGIAVLTATSTVIQVFPTAAAGVWVTSGIKTFAPTMLAYNLVP